MRSEQQAWNVEEAHKSVYAWQHIFIPIVAIYDPDEAIEWYRETLASQGGVGNTSEQFNVYYLIHGIKTVGLRTNAIWAENGASATVYERDGVYTAVCWNPTASAVRYTFRNARGVVGSAVIPACSLVAVDPTVVTENVQTYRDSRDVSVEAYAELTNGTAENGAIVFDGGSAVYLLSCGASEDYRKIVLHGSLENARLVIDGAEYALSSTEEGWETAPVVVTFQHRIEIFASAGALTGITFEAITLKKAEVRATAQASSCENATNVAQNAVDGDPLTRWESAQGSDEEWLVVCLSEAVTVYQMRIFWEAASAAEYTVSFSLTGEDWQQVFAGTFAQNGNREDVITPETVMQVKYIKIEGIRRSTAYGYSIYEIELYSV